MTRSKRAGWSRCVLITAAVIALSATGFARPVQADGRRGRHHLSHRHHRVHHHPRDGHRHVHHRFVIPRRIHARRAGAYRPYFWTRVYVPHHRHYHAVYRFPVHGPYGIDYVPYAYCDGRLFRGVHIAYDGPRFGFRVGF